MVTEKDIHLIGDGGATVAGTSLAPESVCGRSGRKCGDGHGKYGGVVLIPYGLDLIESCLSCKLRAEHILCDLQPAALQSFESIKYPTAYPKGAVLFVEGQSPQRDVLCKGRVRLSICATDGKTLILKIAEPGEVLGLSATVCGKPCELTAETVAPSQVNFVKREDFLRFLKENGEACLRVAEQLSVICNFGMPGNSRPRTFAFRRREAGQAAAGMEHQERGVRQGRAAREAGTDAQGDRADDRYVAGNRDAVVC